MHHSSVIIRWSLLLEKLRFEILRNNQLDCKSYFSQEVEIRDHGKESSCYPVEGTGMFGWCNVRFPDFVQMFRKISSFSFIDFQFHQIFKRNIYVFTNYSIGT